MKKLFFSVVVVVVILAGFANNAMAQISVHDAFAVVNAVVATSGTFTKQTDLNFGSFTTNNSAGALEMATDGTLTETNASPLPASVASSASFDISGTANQSVKISVPSSPYTINRAGGTETMTVTGFISDPTAGVSFALSNLGKATIHVSGKLNIGVAQEPGSYQSTDSGFKVTCNFE